MATPIRTLHSNEAYHVYNRGNRSEPIFIDSHDYIRFLEKAFEYASRDGVAILAYCLMTNHFHFLLFQTEEKGIERMMRSLSTSAAKFYNWQYGQVGHLFQERYRHRQVCDSDDLINAAAYIHFNPAGFTNYETYLWSDIEAKTNVKGRKALLGLIDLTELGYREYLSDYALKNGFRQTTSGVV